MGLVVGLTVFTVPAQSSLRPGNLPLWFEAGGTTEFTAHGGSSEFAISAAETKFALKKSGGATAQGSLKFIGANPAAAIVGEQELAGKINHLIGNQPAQWRTGLPTFARLRVQQVYPGVDLVYYGNRQQLEYDFNLAPDASPEAIVLRFAGAEKISVNGQNELVIAFPAGEIIQHAPTAYQTIACSRRVVAAGYKILDANTATFALGSYDRSQPLVIDPVLSYSTYFGGSGGEISRAIAVNPTDGSIYVAGQTFSTAFTNGVPFATPGAVQTNYLGGSLSGDAFIACFDNSGTNLVYVTYLGGSGNDGILGLAVDSTGHAFLTGFTDSPNFPTTNALFPHIGGSIDKFAKAYPIDGFVTELNPTGSGLIYSTYLGGASMDAAWGIALDTNDNAFVTGFTYSTNFPVTPTALLSHLACTNNFYLNANAFVAEIAAGGSNLLYSTYLGGTNFDTGRAISFNNGRLFVAGFTASTNFPAANPLPGYNRLNGSTNGGFADDAFVTAFTAAGTNVTLLYSTFLGGNNNDQATGIAADAAGNAYVVGWTVSMNFPFTANALTSFGTNSPSFVRTNATGNFLATNAFLTQIIWDGTNTTFGSSAMFGGHGNDVATAVTLAADGNVFVAGSASSTNFPVVNISTNTAYLRPTNAGLSDAFVIAFTNSGTQLALLYSTYLGGSDNDYAAGIAVDPQDAVYVVGQTVSTNFPVSGARQKFRNGTNDMFLTKIALNTNSVIPLLTIAPKAVTASSIHQPKILVPSTPASVSLSWPWAPGYAVESSTNPLAASSWTAVPQSPTLSNGRFALSLPTTNTVGFFRLRHQ